MPPRLNLETRWAIIREWTRKPQTDVAIGRAVGASHQQVRRIINKFIDTDDVTELPRGGRRRKLKKGEATRLLLHKPQSSTREVARALSGTARGAVSHDTVARQARKEGVRYRVRPKKPRLTKEKEKARLKFARQRRGKEYWKSVFASDEHSIQLHSSPRGEWVKAGEVPSPRGTEKFEKSVKVWGGSCWNGLSPIYFISKSMSSREYLSLIESKLEEDILRLHPHPRQPITWLQDREGFHTAKIVQKYLENSSLIPISGWPSNSPDLNWQENVWEVLDQRVRKRMPTTIKGLKKVVKEEWERIDIGIVRKCIHSMPTRLKLVIAAKGGVTKY